jgi:hypothetical protein
MDGLWPFVLFFPLFGLLVIVAVSYKNLKMFFRQQGWVFLVLGIVVFFISLLLGELFSFAQYQLEQTIATGRKYLHLFYGACSMTVRTELWWTAAVFVFMGMMCFLFFFFFRSFDTKKKR